MSEKTDSTLQTGDQGSTASGQSTHALHRIARIRRNLLHGLGLGQVSETVDGDFWLGSVSDSIIPITTAAGIVSYMVTDVPAHQYNMTVMALALSNFGAGAQRCRDIWVSDGTNEDVGHDVVQEAINFASVMAGITAGYMAQGSAVLTIPLSQGARFLLLALHQHSKSGSGSNATVPSESSTPGNPDQSGPTASGADGA